jgi:hypothetical protein
MTHLRPRRLPGGHSRRRAGAALAAALLAALTLAITGSGTALAAPRAAAVTAAITPGCAVTSVSDATWMGDLAPCLQNHLLSQIVIPGSHDSLTYIFNGTALGAGIATTQDEDIVQQLDAGMRSFDIRVGWFDGNNGWGYYAEHNDIYSPTLELPTVFQDFTWWANQPGHEHEIIRISLDINQNGAAFPVSTCQEFGQWLGAALITPAELQAHFGTTDLGQVTLGQLWSLPTSHNDAHVIIDGSSQCMAASDPSAGQWTPSSAYYADWCNEVPAGVAAPPSAGPSSMADLLVAAARQRSTEGTQAPGDPISLGQPQSGGLYELDIQSTPYANVSCPFTPKTLAPYQGPVLSALKNAWLDEPNVRQNLNIIDGDFIEDIPLAADAIAMDESLNAGPGWQVAWLDNTGNLWTSGFDSDHDGPWASGLKAGTSPAITTLPGGGYEIAYQNSSGNLEAAGTAGYLFGPPMMAGTSPAITTLSGGGYEIAIQGRNGHLWSVGADPGSDNHGDWGLGMKAGTSPAITGLPAGPGLSSNGYEMAFQANTGILWTAGTEGTQNLGLGMMADTSPAIAAVDTGIGEGYEAAFQANTGILWTVGFDGTQNWGLGMMAGTSPAIAVLTDGNVGVAFQANTGLMWTTFSNPADPVHVGPYSGAAMAGTSPAITALPDGGYHMVYQQSNGQLHSVGTGGDDIVAVGMMPGTNPSIAATQW